MGIRSRASSGENLRRQRQPKLHHSRSDDNRRQSFDKQSRDSQCSRYSLNTQAVIENEADRYKYFTAPTSLDTEESRTDYSDDNAMDVDEPIATGVSPKVSTEADALFEEPELENLQENYVEGSTKHLDENEICTDNTIATENLIQKDEVTTQSEETDRLLSENCEDLTNGGETILYIADDEV